jgi:hypothetical protein
MVNIEQIGLIRPEYHLESLENEGGRPMLPNQKEAWGQIGLTGSKHSENATAYSLGRKGSQSTTDSESSPIFVRWDGNSVGAAGSPAP